jgi:hypothetical protein
LADELDEAIRQSRAREADSLRERLECPWGRGVAVQQRQRAADVTVVQARLNQGLI